MLSCAKSELISSFAKNIGLVILLNVLIKPAGLILEALVQRDINDETAYGKYAALWTLAQIFSFITDAGISSYITRTIAGDPKRISELFPTVFLVKLAFTLLFPALMLLVGLGLGYEPTWLYLLAIISLTHGLIQFNNFFRANFQGFQLFKIDAFGSNLDKFLFVGLVALLLATIVSIERFVYARLISISATTVVLLYFTFKKKIWHRPRLNMAEAKRVLRLSLPFALMNALFAINESIDQTMVERLAFHGDEAGIYAAAYRWLAALMQYLWIILPMFFARFAFHEATVEDKNRLLKTGTVITAVPLLAAAGFAFFHGNLLFAFFDRADQTIPLRMNLCFVILCGSLALHGLFSILSTYLTSNGHTSFVNKLLIFSITTNVVLNFIFVRNYGAVAAAWTTGVSTLIMSVGYVVYMATKVDIRLPGTTWLKLGLGWSGFLGCLYIGELLDFHWILSTIVAGILFIALILISKTVRMSDLKKI